MAARGKRSIGFRTALTLAGSVFGLCIAALISICQWSLGISGQLQERGDMARRQALLVTRIEADLNVRQWATGNAAARLDRIIAAGVADYLASVSQERPLMPPEAAATDHQQGEAAVTAQLAGRVAAGDIAAARRLSHAIALREDREVGEALAEIATVRSHTFTVVSAIALIAFLAFVLTGWLLWRAIIRPLAAIVEGTRRLAAERAPARVAPRGIAELRDLATRFNDMAG